MAKNRNNTVVKRRISEAEKNSRYLNLKRKQMNRRETRRQFNFGLGAITLVFIIVFAFVVTKTMISPNYEFSLMGILDILSTIPSIDIQAVISAELNFPDWLAFLENIIKIVAVLGSMLINMIATIIWFLQILFM